MGKKGKRGDKPAAWKALMKRLDALSKKLEEELKGADLFAPMPPMDDCPICLVRLPRLKNSSYGTIYKGCCGKSICHACYNQNDRIIKENNAGEEKIESVCPFCREPDPTGLDYLRQLEARSLRGDARACYILGTNHGYSKDEKYRDNIRALKYFIQATELGSEAACAAIAIGFERGKFGVPVDKIASRLFFRVAALRGYAQARHGIGRIEYGLGNHELGIRHWKISATAGFQASLNHTRDVFNANGKLPGKEFISKEELDTIYRKCHEAQEEAKTDEREKHFYGKTDGNAEVHTSVLD
jgi:TPR repeat protein